VAQLIDQKVVLDVPVVDRHGDDDGLAIDQGVNKRPKVTPPPLG
jgi:hypothetical protein